jgi:DNA-binding GntR family transcriptional regulator
VVLHVNSGKILWSAERGAGPVSQPSSLTLEARDLLRRQIIEGALRPRERLIAADLADRLQVSRTPVREALYLLASEGLVVPAKRGFAVREFTPSEIKEIYEVRAALEGMAARLAAERGTREAIDSVLELQAGTVALATSAREVLVDKNTRFHRAIFAAAGNERLGFLNGQNSEHFFNHRIADLYTDEEAAASVEGHRRIEAALRKRDGDAAEKAARDHILEALAVTLRKLR